MIPWRVPKMWEGGECWIIGGGHSMPLQFGVPEDVIEDVLTERQPFSAYSPFLSPIHDRHVIGINTAFLIGPWLDVIFFGDGGFYKANRAKLDAYPKLKVTSSPHLPKKKNDVSGVKFVPRSGRRPTGISPSPDSVSWNLNSGAAAISLAYHFGVKRVYLLGFDMKLSEDGVQHWHRHYTRNRNASQREQSAARSTFRRHLKCFPDIEKDAKRLGLEIVNVSPDSLITAFKRVKLSDVL